MTALFDFLRENSPMACTNCDLSALRSTVFHFIQTGLLGKDSAHSSLRALEKDHRFLTQTEVWNNRAGSMVWPRATLMVESSASLCPIFLLE